MMYSGDCKKVGRVAWFVIQGSGEVVDYLCLRRYRELYPAKSFLTWVIIIVAEKKKINWEIRKIIQISENTGVLKKEKNPEFPEDILDEINLDINMQFIMIEESEQSYWLQPGWLHNTDEDIGFCVIFWCEFPSSIKILFGRLITSRKNRESFSEMKLPSPVNH